MYDIENVYINYSKIVYKYLFCLTHDQEISEELTQETFAVAVKDISKFRKECKIEVWLCQIAKFLWYKELKQRKKICNFDYMNINYINSNIDMEQSLIEKEEVKKMYKKLDKLDELTKQVILLRISAELSFKEIGSLLGRNETWARVVFYRGKEKLKED